MTQDIGQIAEAMINILETCTCGHVTPKKIRYHYRATNVYNYTAVHNTPNVPNYTV